MTIEYHINQRDELITLTVNGSVCASEACVKIDELLNDPDFSADLPQLVDLRLAEIEGDTADFQHFEKFLLGEYRPRLNASVAIVVNPEWEENICAQAFWLSCALHCAEIFDGWNQACKWLIQHEFSASLADLDAITSGSEADDDVAVDDSEPQTDSDHQAEHSQ